jgi:nicotinamide-nucleotide amidase
MRAYILSIGSELILGQLTDTNATYLAQELAAVGIDLVHVTHVGDDLKQLADAIRHALTLADAIICTGGVGPTDDDLTREAIAEVLVEEPYIDDDLLSDLLAFFAGRGQAMPERNKKQAWRIPSAEILPNPVGTAPGWFVSAGEEKHQVIIAMPGVPREMFRMWTEQALPRLQALAGRHVIDSTIIKTIGIGESAAEQVLHDLVLRGDPMVATYAKDDGVHVRVTAVGDDPADTRTRRNACEAEVRALLDQYIWGQDFDTLTSVVGRGLVTRGLRLGVIEHGTGGGLADMFTTDAEWAHLLARAEILPVAFDLGEDDARERAHVLAADAARLDGASAGAALVFAGSVQPLGLVSGTVHLALVLPGEAPRPLPSLTVRTTLAEVQRRSGLHAVDMIRRELPALD